MIPIYIDHLKTRTRYETIKLMIHKTTTFIELYNILPTVIPGALKDCDLYFLNNPIKYTSEHVFGYEVTLERCQQTYQILPEATFTVITSCYALLLMLPIV